MKAICLLFLSLFFFEAQASENSIKSKKVVSEFISEDRLLWTRSSELLYFQIDDETLLRDSLYCTDYDAKISYCTVMATDKALNDWQVQGLIFFVEPELDIIHKFAFITEE